MSYAAAPAQAHFRRRMNRTLVNYRGGFQINEGGQVEHAADEGLDQLIDAAVPTKDPDIPKVTEMPPVPLSRSHRGGLASGRAELLDVLKICTDLKVSTDHSFYFTEAS